MPSTRRRGFRHRVPAQDHCSVHGRFRPDDAGVALEDADGIVGDSKPRKPAAQRPGIEGFEGQSPAPRRLERSEHGPAVGRTENQHAAAVQQARIRFALERLEARGRVAEQGDVLGVLEVGVAEDPRPPVARTALVRWRVLLDAEHPAPVSLAARSAALPTAPAPMTMRSQRFKARGAGPAPGVPAPASASLPLSRAARRDCERHHASVASAVSASGRYARPDTLRLAAVEMHRARLRRRIRAHQRQRTPASCSASGVAQRNFTGRGDSRVSACSTCSQFTGCDRSRGVVDAALVALAELDDPRAEVAHVDPLQLDLRIRRAEHLAAARHALDPVGEPVRVVAGADDVGRPHDGRPGAELRLHDAIALRLERAVGSAGDVLGLRARRRPQRRASRRTPDRPTRS